MVLQYSIGSKYDSATLILMSIIQDLLTALHDFGPMTSVEWCKAAGTSTTKSGRLITSLTHALVRIPKRVYIIRYIFDCEGLRRYPRAVYAIGDKNDAAKPVSSCAENTKRWRESKKRRVNSVWSLGLNVKARLRA